MRGGKAFILFVLGTSIVMAIGAQAVSTLDDAARLVRLNRFTEAMVAIKSSLATGKEKPSRVLSDVAFQPLQVDSSQRAEVRKILAQNVIENELTMVFPNEPGIKLRVEGKVVSQQDGAPKAGVIVYLYQTDAKGIYALIRGEDVGSRNPRLFCFVKTDSAGKFSVNTIVPASYPETTEPRHIHWEIHQIGRQGAFLFDDDPVLTPALRVKEAKYLQKVSEVKGVKVIAPVIKI
ncbi:MAG: hypothetical protein H7Y17_04980 [Chlorobia bacterium]|nr:hypothetical protein [Fimbriimonadaceae bacterium]